MWSNFVDILLIQLILIQIVVVKYEANIILLKALKQTNKPGRSDKI